MDFSGVGHRPFSNSKAVCAIRPGHPFTEKTAPPAGDASARRGRRETRDPGLGLGPVCALALEGVGVGLVNPVAAIDFTERGLVFRTFDPHVSFTTYLLFRPHAQAPRSSAASSPS